MSKITSNITKQETPSAGNTTHKKNFLSQLQQITLPLPSHIIISIALFIIALSFNLYRLGTTSIWFDEAFSVELARQPLPLLWHIIFGPEPNMELYYLFLHFWLGLTGFLGLNPTEFVVRLPSAIFAALSTVVVFSLGRRFLDTIAGVVGASLYLLNFAQLVYAQQTRSYSMQLLFTCLAWYALLIALTDETHSRRWWLCYIVTMVLAIYSHLFSLLILLAQLVAVAGLLLLPNAWRAQTRKQVLAFGVSLLAGGILIIPMLLESLHGAKTGWLWVPHVSDVTHLFLYISGNSKLYLLTIAACCAVGIIATLAGYYLAYVAKQPQTLEANPGSTELRTFQKFMPVAWSLLCWFVLPSVISYVVSQGPTRLFSTRYLVVIVPPLFLLVALAIAVLRWRLVRGVLALVLIALALTTVPFYYHSAQVEDWNAATHWLEQQYHAGDGLVCYDNTLTQGCQIAVEYYLHAYPSGAHFTPDSPGAFSWTTYGPARAAGPDEAVDPTALAAYGAKHPRLFFIVGRVRDDAAAARAQAAQQWMDSHFHLISQTVTPTVTVRLYATGG